MKILDFKKTLVVSLLMIAITGCDIFGEGKILYEKGRYTIRKKNLASYYLASPDLFVKTDKGEVKINLGAYGKNRIAQEKISFTEINEISNDSIQIHFISRDTATSSVQNQLINLNVKQAVDSIQSGK